MEELRIDRGDAELVAWYSPAGETVVVALHGAGEGMRGFFLYEHLHQVLPPAGIGVVTFDRRGEGESTGDASRGRFDVQAADAISVCAAIDVPRVGLWAISQGAWVGPLAAAASDRVAFLVLVAAAGVTPGDQMFHANAEQLRLAGYDETVVERARYLRQRFEDHVHDRPVDEEQLAADLGAALDEPWCEHLYLPPTLFDDETKQLWIAEMDYDPRPSFAAVRVPTLAFYGDADTWIPVQASIDAWRQARGDEVDIVVVPGAEHDMTLPGSGLAPEYERTLVDWLSRARS